MSVIWLDLCLSRPPPCAPPLAGLMMWSLWPINSVCNAGKLDSLFPDDSYIDMGEIDVGRKVAQQIPPGIFWRSQVFIDHPMYLKFNVSLSKDALVGIYGRRGLPPSHTQVGEIYILLTVNVQCMYYSPLCSFVLWKLHLKAKQFRCSKSFCTTFSVLYEKDDGNLNQVMWKTLQSYRIKFDFCWKQVGKLQK